MEKFAALVLFFFCMKYMAQIKSKKKKICSCISCILCCPFVTTTSEYQVPGLNTYQASTQTYQRRLV